jgi:Uma2 family endonuclease
MAVRPARRLFTVDEYHRMVDAGILGKDDRVELLGGEIIAMTPIGPRHAFSVTQLARLLIEQLGSRAVVGVQNPITLDDLSEPQPDVSVAEPPTESYLSRHPGPDDLLLVVEVADSSVDTDRDAKIPRYVATGLREVWFVDLELERVEVHRLSDESQSPRIVGRGERIAPEAFPEVLLSVDEVLGPRT